MELQYIALALFEAFTQFTHTIRFIYVEQIKFELLSLHILAENICKGPPHESSVKISLTKR